MGFTFDSRKDGAKKERSKTEFVKAVPPINGRDGFCFDNFDIWYNLNLNNPYAMLALVAFQTTLDLILATGNWTLKTNVHCAVVGPYVVPTREANMIGGARLKPDRLVSESDYPALTTVVFTPVAGRSFVFIRAS